MNSTNSNSTDYIVTRQQYDLTRFVIYLVCIPVIAICGIIGNTFSVYILQKYPTKHAFVIYLKALTATDTFLLLMSLLQSFFKMCVSVNMKNAQKIETYASLYVGIIIGSFLQRLSSAFIAVIAVERFLAVSFPFRFRRMSMEKRPARILTCLTCFFVVLQIPTLFVVEVKEVLQENNNTIYIISRTNSSLQKPVLTMVYLFTIAGFGIGLPLCFVLVSTSCILSKLKYENRNFVRSKVCSGSIEMEKMTLTLVVLATFFAAMSIPALLIYIWTAIDRSVESTYMKAILIDVNIVLICLNSSSDFIIYCMTSKKFGVLFFENVSCRPKDVEQPTQEREVNLQEIDTISRAVECTQIS